jgi:hypothetical protein
MTDVPNEAELRAFIHKRVFEAPDVREIIDVCLDEQEPYVRVLAGLRHDACRNG